MEVESKNILNLLGKGILDNFKRKKEKLRQYEERARSAHDPESAGGKSLAQRLERPLLVKDIRTKMGQEMVRLMHKNKIRNELEKTVKDLLG